MLITLTPEIAIKIMENYIRKTKTEPCKKCGNDVVKTSYMDPNSVSEYWGFTCKHCQKAQRKITIKTKKEFKLECLEYIGTSCCSKCGYNKNLAALHFHHTDPSNKSFQISTCLYLTDNVKAELSKCILLCSNCHTEYTHPRMSIS